MVKLAMVSTIMNPKAYSGNNDYSTNVSFVADKKDEVVLKQVSEPAADKKQKWTTRKVIDAATVGVYVTLIASAIAMKKSRSGIVKLVEKRKNLEKAEKVTTSEIKHEASIMSGKAKKGSMVYSLFNYFGKLKGNSEELTNNLVYGFGTLVVMPLVILFSPFGRKQATKEDRTFTVLRQPISFATLFTMQLTFDKIFKSLIGDMNKYNLLEGIKGKNGKNLQFKNGPVYKELEASLQKYLEKSQGKSIQFDEESLKNTSKFGEELSIINDHITTKGNKFGVDEFSKNIKSLLGDYPSKKRVENVKDMIGNYKQEIPELSEHIEKIVKIGMRGRALKEVSVVVANSILSQALGIMMLNVVYGKMMKKYTHFKESVAKPEDSAKGGSK